MNFFFLKLIICNIDIHTCFLDSTFLCPYLYKYKYKKKIPSYFILLVILQLYYPESSPRLRTTFIRNTHGKVIVTLISLIIIYIIIPPVLRQYIKVSGLVYMSSGYHLCFYHVPHYILELVR